MTPSSNKFTKAKRQRLDVEMVRRHFVVDEVEAQQLIEQKRVFVSGSLATTPNRMVEPAEPLHVEAPSPKFVSRGGTKLEAALIEFGIEVKDKRAIDVGASTGGFTDCLLQCGAKSVVAVDVGRAQLHQKLRADSRVDNRERTDVRKVEVDELGGAFEVVTVDVSFISLRNLAATLVEELAAPNADIVTLIKPQFESTHAEASAGKGVITDPVVWRRVIDEVLSAMSACGAATMGVMLSPIRGGEGNAEFLAWFRRCANTRETRARIDPEPVIAAAIATTGAETQ